VFGDDARACDPSHKRGEHATRGRVDDAGRVVVHVAGDDGAGGPVGVVSRGAAAPIGARAVMAAARLTPNGSACFRGHGATGIAVSAARRAFA